MESVFRKDDSGMLRQHIVGTMNLFLHLIRGGSVTKRDRRRERTGKRERGVRARRDANVQEEKGVCGARAGKEVGTRRGNICRVQQSRTPAVW